MTGGADDSFKTGVESLPYGSLRVTSRSVVSSSTGFSQHLLSTQSVGQPVACRGPEVHHMATAPALGMLTLHWELGRAGQRAAKPTYVGREMLCGLGAERVVRAGRCSWPAQLKHSQGQPEVKARPGGGVGCEEGLPRASVATLTTGFHCGEMGSHFPGLGRKEGPDFICDES